MNVHQDPVVQTAGLTKIFKDFWRRNQVEAVKDLNMEIRPGEVFGLLGPNGSGKSTTIKMLLGLLYPTRGRISIFGRAPTDVAVKSRIGFLPEESYLYRFLNARETLDFYARLFQQPGAVRAERIERLLEMVGLVHEAKRRVGEYSKGMARRIGLAQALINDPELLILDEPTTGLDPIGTRQIKDVIVDLAKRGKTILLSSHLLADVEDVCDRVSILYGGQQRAGGRTDDLLQEENRTQITTDRLTDEQIEHIRDYVRRLEGKQVVNVSSPRVSLESYFMRIVGDAQRENVKTSGARAAGQLPSFLSAEPAGPTVIDTLITAARAPQRLESIEPKPDRPKKAEPSREVLDQLTTPLKKEEKPEPAKPAEPQPAPAQRRTIQADQSVIDSLLRQSDKPSDE